MLEPNSGHSLTSVPHEEGDFSNSTATFLRNESAQSSSDLFLEYFFSAAFQIPLQNCNFSLFYGKCRLLLHQHKIKSSIHIYGPVLCDQQFL
jgi:hypothetical protein